MEKLINTKVFRERKIGGDKNYGRVLLLPVVGNIYSGILVDRTRDLLTYLLTYLLHGAGSFLRS